ncbi:hypothetical protein [Filifactor villosus]|uniref:Uncharacterized protein n=1 Tax=Filifactor villosus TaxID=29374 RepID=A0ABV9QNJ2_9FIRM
MEEAGKTHRDKKISGIFDVDKDKQNKLLLAGYSHWGYPVFCIGRNLKEAKVLYSFEELFLKHLFLSMCSDRKIIGQSFCIILN